MLRNFKSSRDIIPDTSNWLTLLTLQEAELSLRDRTSTAQQFK